MAEKRKLKVSAERLVIFGLLIALTFTLAGFAIASAATKMPAGNGLVRFCRDNTSGSARIVELTTKCLTTEQKVQMRSYDPIGLEYEGHQFVEHILKNIGGHVTGVTHDGTGQYTVTFDRSVTNCVATPTLTDSSASTYVVTGNTPNANEKTVASFLLVNNNPIDTLFDLVITC